MTIPNLSPSRRVALALSMFAAAAILVPTLWPSGPRRLRELPDQATASGPGVTITPGVREGRLLRLSPDRSALVAEPAVGGRAEPVARVPTEGIVRQARVTPRGTLFLTETPAPSNSSTGPAGPPAVSRTPARMRVWEVEGSGEPPRELLAHLRTEVMVLSAETCFWTRPRPPRTVRIRVGSRTLRDTVRENDLLATPLYGGPTRVVVRALSAYAPLAPLGEGVTWTKASSEDPRRTDRYFALPPDFQVRAVRDCSDVPVLHQGRLWWFQSGPPPSPGTPGSTPRLDLVSSRLDGTDRRVILDLAGSSHWDARQSVLRVHASRLYAVLYRRIPESRLGSGTELPMLCRVDLDGVRELARLPASITGWEFDGDDVYLTAVERHENWLAWSGAGLKPRRVTALFRLRLPPQPAPSGVGG